MVDGSIRNGVGLDDPEEMHSGPLGLTSLLVGADTAVLDGKATLADPVVFIFREEGGNGSRNASWVKRSYSKPQ